MEILKKAFGIYATNCYIAKTKIGDFIIDAGVGSAEWVLKNATSPRAILNTHGHFDHIWDNFILKQKLNIDIFCPKEDCFMLDSDCFGLGLSPQSADVKVENNEKFCFFKDKFISKCQGEKCDDCVLVEFLFFPGHTPGCSMIKIDEAIFSGDFIFKDSIGRSDFPYSNENDMQDSLRRFGELKMDCPIYPGHGENTSVRAEQANLNFWIKRS